jgi:hypothetical protein
LDRSGKYLETAACTSQYTAEKMEQMAAALAQEERLPSISVRMSFPKGFHALLSLGVARYLKTSAKS